MDLNKFIYNDITPDLIERFYNEGKDIKIRDLDEFMKLPLNTDNSTNESNEKEKCDIYEDDKPNIVKDDNKNDT